MMKKILITGANGFMGRGVLAACDSSFEVFTLGRANPLEGGAAPAFTHQHISVDLGQAGALDQAIKAGQLPAKLDAVVHLAVSRLHRTFPKTAPDMFQVNVAAAASLLDYAHVVGVEQFILGSTGTVYHPFPHPVCKEDETTRPESYFGWSKLAAEDCARLYEKHFKLFISRFFTPYGIGQSDRLVDGLMDKVRSGTPITIPETGKGLTSAPMYLDDAVNLLMQALKHGWTGIVNAAGEEALAIEEMAALMGEHMGKTPVIERSSAASGAVLIPDITRLKTLMNTAQFVPFREGIGRVIRAKGW
jgi:UDP-glucose 4-epimerase